EYAALSVDQQQGNDSILRFTSEALAVRKRYRSMVNGGMRFANSGRDSVLIVERKAEDETVVALFNFGDEDYAISEELIGGGEVVLSSRPLKENLLNNNVLPKRTGVWVRAG
ncbi:MAG: DUF3459 domain-containing protein, partial [Henriciella sp.]|nr:DUF3459 domain-containing protein [Henriciella sp.]